MYYLPNSIWKRRSTSFIPYGGGLSTRIDTEGTVATKLGVVRKNGVGIKIHAKGPVLVIRIVTPSQLHLS